MADKRTVKRTIKELQRIKTWQLLVLLLLLGFLSATFLRLNNIGMVERRTAVLAADKAGDDSVTLAEMTDLQNYVAAHMDANTSQFYLQGAYSRDAQAAVDLANTYVNPNGNINEKAEAYCKPQFTVWSEAYVQCFAAQLAKYPPSPDPNANVKLPNAAVYAHNFASPLWSPDFAGWSLVGCGVIVIMIIARLISLAILRLLLHRHYRGI